MWPLCHPDHIDAVNNHTLPNFAPDLGRWCLLTIDGAAPRPNAGRNI
jgi:hypothetical protein